MKYISIGKSCCVKYQIDKIIQKSESLFFDNLMTSMNAVIDILNSPDINNILHFENIITDPINNADPINNRRVSIKSLDYCISIHDIKKNFTSDDIFKFIEKYKRRFNRIIEYIKSNETIVFIRYGAVDNLLIYKFIETILKINSNCKFWLCVVDNDNSNDVEILKFEKCLYFKLNIPVVMTDYTASYLNWEKIFDDIENNLH